MNMENKEFKFYIDFYKDDIFESENLYTIDWVDSDTCLEMCKFADKINSKYDSILSIPFLLLAGMEFMSEIMECNSCPVREKYFEEFEQFLIRKIKEYAI